MSSNPSMPGRGRYIIRAQDSLHLVDFLRTTSCDPNIVLVDTIGPEGQPHTAVFELSHDTARSLEQRFLGSPQLKIEPDRPLSLF
ncbi:MAG: hypothetical protein V4805_13580 [Pseudomonadota bacterium]